MIYTIKRLKHDFCFSSAGGKRAHTVFFALCDARLFAAEAHAERAERNGPECRPLRTRGSFGGV